MKILQLATVDHGGATYFYRDALLQHTEHECRAVRTYQGKLEYPGDILAPDAETLAELYQWADVIHLHDEAGALVREYRPKPVVITYHGTRYRKAPGQFNQRCADRGWILTVSTIDLTEWSGEWVPTPRRDVAHDYQPARRFVVAHAPTDRERKRTDLIIDAVKQARGCKLQLIEAQPYRRCMQKKARARVLVDGWLGYGNNAVEAWALGMPVISGAPAELIKRMTEAWGYVPFLSVDNKRSTGSLRNALEILRDWPTWYAEYKALGRSHYLAYHHPYHVSRRLVRLYERALDRD